MLLPFLSCFFWLKRFLGGKKEFFSCKTEEKQKKENGENGVNLARFKLFPFSNFQFHVSVFPRNQSHTIPCFHFPVFPFPCFHLHIKKTHLSTLFLFSILFHVSKYKTGNKEQCEFGQRFAASKFHQNYDCKIDAIFILSLTVE